MRIVAVICMLICLPSCSSLDFTSEDKYGLRFSHNDFISISALGRSWTRSLITADDYSMSRVASINGKTINVYIEDKLVDVCKSYGVDADLITMFASDLITGESPDDNVPYNASIYLTQDERFYYEIHSDIETKDLAFVFFMENCESYHDTIAFAYSIIQHERKHVEILLSEKYKKNITL